MNRSQPLRRTPLARTSGLARVAGLRRNRPQRPPSRPAHLDVPTDTRAAVLARSGGCCEAGITGVCLGAAGDIHHRRRRGLGPNPHHITNLLHVCGRGAGTPGCHGAIHAAPTQAREAGWMVSTYSSEPATKPVLIRGRLAYLMADGSYESAESAR